MRRIRIHALLIVLAILAVLFTGPPVRLKEIPDETETAETGTLRLYPNFPDTDIYDPEIVWGRRGAELPPWNCAPFRPTLAKILLPMPEKVTAAETAAMPPPEPMRSTAPLIYDQAAAPADDTTKNMLLDRYGRRVSVSSLATPPGNKNPAEHTLVALYGQWPERWGEIIRSSGDAACDEYALRQLLAGDLTGCCTVIWRTR